MMTRIFLTAFLLCFCGGAMALAAETPKDPPVEPENKQEMMKDLNADIDQQIAVATKEREEAAKEAYDQIDTLILGLKAREQKHFFMLYGNYNVIETVKDVEKSVGKTIKACGENNPDMKDELDSRFKAWKEAVNPLVKEAEGNFRNMVLAQDYVTEAEMNNIFSYVDKAREKSQSAIEKIPVTTPEGCQYLKSKMEETEQSMTSLLRSTLVSFPKAFQDMGDEDLKLPKLDQKEKKEEE